MATGHDDSRAGSFGRVKCMTSVRVSSCASSTTASPGTAKSRRSRSELNGDASILDVIDEVRVFVLPQLQQILAREGALPSWTRVGRFAGSRAASNPAVALLEMALLDRELRATNTTIEALWPARFDTPLQTTVSLIDDVAVDVDRSTARVRAKVSGAALSPAAGVLLGAIATRSLPVLLDYNCSARSDDDGDRTGATDPRDR